MKSIALKLLAAVALLALALGVARLTGIWSTVGPQKPPVTKQSAPKAPKPKVSKAPTQKTEQPTAPSAKGAEEVTGSIPPKPSSSKSVAGRNSKNIPLWILKLPHKEQEEVCMTLNIRYESRGEPTLGKQMVAHVTHKRAELKRSYWGETVCENVFKKRVTKKKNRKGKIRTRAVCEYSWTCMRKFKPTPATLETSAEERRLARAQLAGEFIPPAALEPALYYLRPAHSSRNGRAFFKKLVYLDTVGHHLFYGEKKRS